MIELISAWQILVRKVTYYKLPIGYLVNLRIKRELSNIFASLLSLGTDVKR